MIKITQKCSMGCKHCMNDATPEGRHMSIEKLKDVMDFIKKINLKGPIIISGGEPTEHPDFEKFCYYIMEYTLKNDLDVTYIVTTNGFWIVDHPEETKKILALGDELRKIEFQVSADVRYYPKRLPVHKRILREKGIILCDDCVGNNIYPQGRAVKNHIEQGSSIKMTRCANCHLMATQLKINGNLKLSTIVNNLFKANKFCTPHIRPDGSIAIGESDLCPVVSNIYKSDEEIGKDIFECTCNECQKYLKPIELQDLAFKFIPNNNLLSKLI